jgi:tetratricopeptide (TPR) repeat protein
MQGQLDMTAGTAITELQAALEGTADTDSNHPLVLAKLGEAYEADGKYTEAADAYQKAVAMKPDPAYYNNLGNCLARLGKTDEATNAYQQAIITRRPSIGLRYAQNAPKGGAGLHSVRGQGSPIMRFRSGEFPTGTTGNFQPELTQ